MFYLLGFYLIGCAAVGHLIAHGGLSAWGLLPFLIFGIVALELGFCATTFLRG